MRGRYAGRLTDAEVGRVLEQHFVFDYGPEVRERFTELPWVVANHLDLNYAKVVRRGLRGIRDDLAGRLAASDVARRTFYESALVAVEAAVRFIERQAEALRQAAKGEDAERGTELRDMAAVCDRITHQAPATFREALQLVWLVHVIANVGGGSALSFARFDQYLEPFYRRDLEAGRLTREEAKVLVGCLWLKVNEPKMRTVQSLCLAGTTPEGDCGANDLTRLCLEVCREVQQPYPNCSVRVSRQTPEWLWDEIAATMQAGGGHPMLLNDGTWIPSFERLGYPPDAARDYYNMGCVEMMVQGRTGLWAGCGSVDLPGLLELVLRNGGANLAGTVGAPTGALEDLTTFEAFLNAYLAQIEHQVAAAGRYAEQEAAARAGRWFDPFASALVDDCVERGLDLYQGGSRFPPILPVSSRGIGTAADSLAAIKRVVYDQQRRTLRALWDLLERDYEGEEALRAELEHSGPCFGNDEAEVDAIAQRIFAAYTDAVHALNQAPTAPGTFVTMMFSYTGHISGGEVTAATPNGRRRGEPISNGIDPSQGRDLAGPTALVNSVTSLEHSRLSGACAFNLKLDPGLMRGATGSRNLQALLKTYIERGGCQIQVNLVDHGTLLEAQQHPERHRNLIVRVAGYSEYFTSLDRRLQDEVIRRTAHALEGRNGPPAARKAPQLADRKARDP
jgi:formate C-acetyltransferase